MNNSNKARNLIIAAFLVIVAGVTGYFVGISGAVKDQGAALFNINSISPKGLTATGTTQNAAPKLYWGFVNGKEGCYNVFLDYDGTTLVVEKVNLSEKLCVNAFPSDGSTGAVNKGPGLYLTGPNGNVTDNFNGSCTVKFADGTTAKGTAVHNEMNLFLGCDTTTVPKTITPGTPKAPVPGTLGTPTSSTGAKVQGSY
jgi:hypothetical protein